MNDTTIDLLTDEDRAVLWQTLGQAFDTPPRSPEAALTVERVVQYIIARRKGAATPTGDNTPE